MTTRSKLDWLIWSADVANEEALMSNLDRLPDLDMVKLDQLFLWGTDLTVIDRTTDRGLKVFADLKTVEIPSKLFAIATERFLPHRPWMLNCMAGVLSNGQLTGDELDGLKRFADACHKVGTRPCGVTVLTTKDPEIIKAEFNGRTNIEQVLYYVGELVKCGFTDVVCSPQEAQSIRTISDFDGLDINCPGIRMPDSPPDDQARTMTPEEARLARVTRQVVGRPLTKGDIARNLELIEANYLGTVA